MVEAGRFRAAADVFPVEPVPAEARARRVENLLLSAHRAGGIPQAFSRMGEMVVEDLALILAGLPPVKPAGRPPRDREPLAQRAGPKLRAGHAAVTGLAQQLGLPPGARVAILHVDDVGMCHGANVAFLELARAGFVDTGSVMVPCPWFPEIAAAAAGIRPSTSACI